VAIFYAWVMDNQLFTIISKCECFEKQKSEILFSAVELTVHLSNNITTLITLTSFRKYCALCDQQVDTISVFATTGKYFITMAE
jgi:hypothetical protein